jgi:hypothetical protein
MFWPGAIITLWSDTLQGLAYDEQRLFLRMFTPCSMAPLLNFAELLRA